MPNYLASRRQTALVWHLAANIVLLFGKKSNVHCDIEPEAFCSCQAENTVVLFLAALGLYDCHLRVYDISCAP